MRALKGTLVGRCAFVGTHGCTSRSSLIKDIEVDTHMCLSGQSMEDAATSSRDASFLIPRTLTLKSLSALERLTDFEEDPHTPTTMPITEDKLDMGTDGESDTDTVTGESVVSPDKDSSSSRSPVYRLPLLSELTTGTSSHSGNPLSSSLCTFHGPCWLPSIGSFPADTSRESQAVTPSYATFRLRSRVRRQVVALGSLLKNIHEPKSRTLTPSLRVLDVWASSPTHSARKSSLTEINMYTQDSADTQIAVDTERIHFERNVPQHAQCTSPVRARSETGAVDVERESQLTRHSSDPSVKSKQQSSAIRQHMRTHRRSRAERLSQVASVAAHYPTAKAELYEARRYPLG
jgi:hypothetical protein